MLRKGKSVKVQVAGASAPARGGRVATGRGGRKAASGPREGSLPARIGDWARKLKKEFDTNAVARVFKLSRAHASMLLSKLSADGRTVRRASRGRYSAV